MRDWCFSPKQPETSTHDPPYGWAMQTLADLVGRKEASSSASRPNRDGLEHVVIVRF